MFKYKRNLPGKGPDLIQGIQPLTLQGSRNYRARLGGVGLDPSLKEGEIKYRNV